MPSVRCRRALVAVVAVVALAACRTPEEAPVPAGSTPQTPVRGAFYYPWYPEAWSQRGIEPFTRNSPTLGFYDSRSQAVVRAHLAALEYGRIQLAIASWWGRGSKEDARLPMLLRTTAEARSPVRWAVYHEQEGNRYGAGPNPSVEALRADLAHLRDRHGSDPSYYRIDGRFVVFVYGEATDGCGTARRWAQANADVGAFIVLKVFAGYRKCADQPDGWHQYAPAVPTDSQAGHSFSISPGFTLTGERTRLERDLERWRRDVQAMVASDAPFQLVTTFNEWGENSAVESAQEWATPSGFGAYLDALHSNGGR